eukprot:TRINITY_DN3214_c0_g1_i7.p1 TRINITY_DN3214_c0_g1~~TRINITY_DN3214_c0_g1_i7.p1  ORF type:complete len:428 (+),score=20.25 TRINITY_DN3214_c0_g1_i7:75-1358(+)
MTNLNHLRPRGKTKTGEISLSDLLFCPVLFPIALYAGTSTPSVLSSSLTLSSWIVYLLDYRSTGSQTGFPFSSFLPAWLCIATSSDLTTSRFRLYLSFWTVLLYRPLFNKIILKFSKSFTFGEGSIIVQGILLALHSSLLRLEGMDSYRTFHMARKVADWLKWFQDHCSNPTSMSLLTSWVALSVLSVLVVIIYKVLDWRVTTATRKIFHLSVILVYLPGLKYDPALLYYCSIGATLVFISLELLRWSEKLPFLTNGLSAYLKHFTDEKEGGSLILTNIYLLVGVSLPLWLWPGSWSSPVPLSLYTGILSVGIYDAAASLVGSRFGRLRFSSGKSLEGMIGGCLAALIAIIAIQNDYQLTEDIITQFGEEILALNPRHLTFVAACLVTSVAEVMVDQVDNLILPMVMYSALLGIPKVMPTLIAKLPI